MDKDLLEKILESGISVQGDLVLEKHVENEIGNVENGGIGIQIVHGKADGDAKTHDSEAQPQGDALHHYNMLIKTSVLTPSCSI